MNLQSPNFSLLQCQFYGKHFVFVFILQAILITIFQQQRQLQIAVAFVPSITIRTLNFRHGLRSSRANCSSTKGLCHRTPGRRSRPQTPGPHHRP